MSSQAVAWAIIHKAGGPSAKAVLLSIANYADAHGECWQDQQTLADGAECGVRQFRTIVTKLVSRGLVERKRRGGSGRGRQTDLLRLRMRELPAIITASRRPESGADSNRQTLPLAVSERRQPAISSNRQTLPLAVPECRQPAKNDGNEMQATGNLAYGNRQFHVHCHIKDNPTIPTKSMSARFLADMRPIMSRAGNHRSKPKLCEKALAPLIAKHGYDRLLAAAKAWYAQPEARKERGEFQPGLQVIANDGRLEAMLAPPPPRAAEPDWVRYLALWRDDPTSWPTSLGPRPNELGYRGPRTAVGGQP